MKPVAELLSNRWIIKEREKEKYYQVKDGIGVWRDFIREKLGYRLIDNSLLLKLEKIPGEAQPWMGITEFLSKEEYVYLCLVLMFLEDKGKEEQFVLSELTEYLQANYPDGKLEWTIFENRRRLIRVIKYIIKQGFIINNDGNEEDFASELETEVLYENTGVSKYFARNFTRDISEYSRPEDFMQSDWMELDEDRGIIRRQRVYRKLLLSPGVYQSQDKDEDIIYIKNYRSSLEYDLNSVLDGELHVHRTSAYFVLGENEIAGKNFPSTSNLSDAILLVFYLLQEDVKSGSCKPDVNEIILLSKEQFMDYIVTCKRKFGAGFSKKYREDLNEAAFVQLVMNEMKNLGMIKEDAVTEEILVMPIVGKLSGIYSKEFLEKENMDVS